METTTPVTPAPEIKPEVKPESKSEVKPETKPEAMQELLESINKNVVKQTRFSRLAYFNSLLGLVVAVVALLALGMKLFPLIDQVSTTLSDVQTTIAQVQTTLTDMKLAEVMTNVNELTKAGTEGINDALVQVGDAMKVINEFDIEGLNAGIQQLNDVVEPMAKFFGRR